MQGWGSTTEWNVNKTPLIAAGSLKPLQRQRKTSIIPNQRRPSLLFSAFLIVAIAGGVSAGWWWTSADNRGSGKGVKTTSIETVSLLGTTSLCQAYYCLGPVKQENSLQELDEDIQKVTHAGKDGIKGNKRDPFASASDVVDQQLAELGTSL